ncbi:MAG: TlpA disulfide reductase family protein [Candidatus Acidiferrum sp.]
MKIRSATATLLLLAAGTAFAGLAVFAAPQTRVARDPELIDVQGFQKILQQNRGKPLLVTFWATWCEPCRDEYPMVNELAKQYAPKGLRVVGISLDDDGDMILVRRFLARYKPIFPNYRNTPGEQAEFDTFKQTVMAGWNATLPASFFYDRDGRQISHFIGEKSREQYEEAIRELLAAGGGAVSQGK